jgi:hypothetical protein
VPPIIDRMKSLVVVLMLSGALGLAAGCGPEEAFCPNAGADAGGVCPIFGDDALPPVQDMGMVGGLCGPNQQATIGPDGGVICVNENQ